MSLPRCSRWSARPRADRLRARFTACLLAGAVGLGATIALVPATAQATVWPGHPDRSLVRHTVRAGETATGLAVRYHAWTDELIGLNRLDRAGTLYRGRVIRIPVVRSAVRRAHARSSPARTTKHRTAKHRTTRHRTTKHRTTKHRTPGHRPLLRHRLTPRPRGWLHADLTRTQVRHLVSRMARRYHVPRTLALAVAWQESGWQQRRVSKAGALGVMQVMPATGRWMRWYAGRRLRLHDTHDNIQAGLLTLRTLRSWTTRDNNAIAAYYQGLGAVRRHGYYRDTKRYVRSVRALQRHLIRTGNPV